MKAPTLVAAVALGPWLSPAAFAQQPAIISKPVAEKRVMDLPDQPPFWRVENFPTTAEALAASSDHSLAVEAFGKGWLFTLGPQGQASISGVKVADIGQLPQVTASQYLLRVNEGSGVPGSTTSVHTHPGSEADHRAVRRGQSENAAWGKPHLRRSNSGGHGADTVMQFMNSGTTDVRYFALFLVDATKPFTSPAKFE